MNTRIPGTLLAVLLLLSTVCLPLSTALAQGTAFTYQGRLNDNAYPANGIHDMRFAIYDLAAGGGVVAGPTTNLAVAVSNGLFAVTLDFGASVFTGTERWLEIGVRAYGGDAFVTLTPRQPLTPSPYAIFAGGVNAAGISGGIPAGQLVGTLGESQVPTNIARLNPPNTAQQATGAPVVTSGFITSATVIFGGSGYTSAPPVTLTGGSGAVITATVSNGVVTALTVQNPGSGYSADATLTIAPPPSNAFQTFSGKNIFSGTNVFSGLTTLTNPNNAFAGNFAGDGGGLTNVNGTTLGGVAASAFWKLTGNSVAAGQFLGSTGNQPLELWANGYRVLRLEPDPDLTVYAGNIVGGYTNNMIEQPGSGGNVIVGGGYYAGLNVIRTNSRGNFIGAGSANQIGPNINDGVIGGGFGNTVQSFTSFIGGGNANTIKAGAFSSTIGGGNGNTIQISAGQSTIGGGDANAIQALAEKSTISGGSTNTIQTNAYLSTIGGGLRNAIQASAYESTIGGGGDNTIQTDAAFSTISGGGFNTIQTNAFQSTIGGGISNTIQTNARNSTIAGGNGNSIKTDAHHSTIGGGGGNIIQTGSHDSTIAGGFANVIQPGAYFSTIGGGIGNTIQTNAFQSTIGGGLGNTIQTNAFNSTIAGGIGNAIQMTASNSIIAGGRVNTIQTNAFNSAIGGGSGNSIGAGAQYATIPGGNLNSVADSYGFAAGNRAKANHLGSFVWADSQVADFASTAIDQFSVRAGGGIRFAANAQIGTGNGDYRQLRMGGGNSAGFLYGSFAALNDGIHLGYNYYYDAVGSGHLTTAGGATSRITVGYGAVTLAVGAVNGAPTINRLVADNNGVSVFGTFNNFSDRNGKQDFAPVSSGAILDKVIRLPLSEWSYKEDSATRHIGPMAQDFHSVFNIGTDDKHIAPIDEGGVALAAIQGLNQKLTDELRQKGAEIAELRQAVNELKELVKAMTEKPGGGAK